jgi:ELWxxDGT repeat protein
VEGTRLFKDIAPGAASSSPSQFIVVDGSLYFVADDQVHGEEPWTARSMDPSRTFLVRDFVPGPESSYARLLAGLHGELFLTIHPADRFDDLELWRTDGWPHAAVRVRRFTSTVPGLPELFTAQSAVTADGLLYFVIQPFSDTGPGAGFAQLWRTDGTTKGTRFLHLGLTYGDEGPTPELFAVDETVLFASWDDLDLYDPQQHGQELWRSTGTTSGTRLLQDLRPGRDSSHPSSFVRAGGFVYFVALEASGTTFRLWALPEESVRCPRPL